MPVLFALTLFVSATLLFMVQPMVGRKILPLLGGSPAAWNTCMVFFQALLLGGYYYAHKITSKLPTKTQFTVHIAVILAALAALGVAALVSPDGSPIAVLKSLAPQGTSDFMTIVSVLILLAVAIGVPFFVVSTSAPLLQRWFAHTTHPSAKDPYFLYAVSNAGSLISLLGYPVLVEPTLGLPSQGWVWAAGFLALFGLTFACGRMTQTWAAPRPPVAKPEEEPTPSRKLRWVLLGFVPSSLMLGVTFHMTTDIASIPLLWIIPLALYLVTFIIAYARLPRWFRPVLGNVSPVVTLLLVFVMTSGLSSDLLSPFFSIVLHVVAFFFTALLMHSELAHDRPGPVHLPYYFLWISLGGMLGGVFNGLVAPLVFPDSYEYRIAIVVGAMLIPTLDDDPKPATAKTYFFDVVVPALMIVLVIGLAKLHDWTWFYTSTEWVARQFADVTGLEGRFAKPVRLLVVYALPAMACFAFIDRPIRFGLCVAVILGVGIVRKDQSYVVETHRSFFGILRVTTTHENYRDSADDLVNSPSYLYWFVPADPKAEDRKVKAYAEPEDYLQLIHGTTLHGTQATRTWTYAVRDDLPRLPLGNPWATLAVNGAVEAFDMRQEPLTYYHRTGPVGDAFAETYRRTPDGPVAMIGLGTGSVACYAQPGQNFTFFEIDPTVVRIVDRPRDPNPVKAARQFTYLADARARGAKLDIVLGDARLKLEELTDRRYALLLVDAFSSDSIPVHLLTKEAVELYMNRLTEHGLLMVHISNKFVRLEPVVAKIAEELKLEGRVFSDSDQRKPGKSSSHWVVLARTPADLGKMAAASVEHGKHSPMAALAGNAAWQTFEPDWKLLTPTPGVKLWTDQYADVMQVSMLKEVQAIRRFFGQPDPFQKSSDD